MKRLCTAAALTAVILSGCTDAGSPEPADSIKVNQVDQMMQKQGDQASPAAAQSTAPSASTTPSGASPADPFAGQQGSDANAGSSMPPK